MPLLLLVFLLTEFLTVFVIGLDIYLFREWYLWKDTVDDEYGRRCLYWAIGLAAYSLIGKYPLTFLVSKRRKGEDEPGMKRLQGNERLRRPDGSEIYIEYEGNPAGKPILFVHGWNENSTIWYYQTQHFVEKGYRVIRMDLAGLGMSKRPSNKDFSLQKMAKDLQAVIDHLRLDRPVLWGHSIGGMVILTYCAEIASNLQHIRGIVLQHTTYTDPTRTSIMNKLLHSIEKPVLYPICWLMIALSPVFWLSKWMSYLNGNMLLSTRFITFAGTQTHRQLDFVSRLSAMAPPAVFARGMLGMMKTYDVTGKLKGINVPALIFGANSDRLTKPSASDFMEREMPDATQVRLAPAGHQGLIERHAETTLNAARFIDELPE